MQLAFYLYKLKEHGIDAKGRLLFPEERRRVDVELDSKLKDEVENTIIEIEHIIKKPFPPPLKKIGYCKYCAYKKFCMS